MRLGLPSGKLTQLLKMTIEIVDLPLKNSDVPQKTITIDSTSFCCDLVSWYEPFNDRSKKLMSGDEAGFKINISHI